MIWRVRVEKLNSRRMLLVTFLVIFTGIVAWFPSIIANFGNINMNYEVSQIFTVTLFYLNSVSDPIIYILGYPSVKNYIRGLTQRSGRKRTSYISSSTPAVLRRSDNDLRTIGIEGELSTVSPNSHLQPCLLRGSFNSSARCSRVSFNLEKDNKPSKNFRKHSIKRSFNTSSKDRTIIHDAPKMRRYTVSYIQKKASTGSLAVRRGSTSVPRLDHYMSHDADIIRLDCLNSDCTVLQNSPDSLNQKTV